MNFKWKTDDDILNQIYKGSKIMSFTKIMQYNNNLFAYSGLTGQLPVCFNNKFEKLVEIHEHQTRGALTAKLNVPIFQTREYGHHSVKL